jgi:hypothetical protein
MISNRQSARTHQVNSVDPLLACQSSGYRGIRTCSLMASRVLEPDLNQGPIMRARAGDHHIVDWSRQEDVHANPRAERKGWVQETIIIVPQRHVGAD